MLPPDDSLSVTPLGPDLALGFAYHPARVGAVKGVPGRFFDAETRRWLVPRSQAPRLYAGLVAAEAPASWASALAPFVGAALAEMAGRQARFQRAYDAALPQLRDPRWGLFGYQREGVEFLLHPRETRGALLADEMGLGKTRQAIVAAHLGHPEGRILVLCPAGLKLNWAKEIRLALGPAAEVAVARGGELPLARWTVFNYDLLKRHHAALLAERWACLIADEAHYLKNRLSQRSLLVAGGETRGKDPRRVAGLAEACERVFLLTGTPLTNRPLDLFPLLKAIAHPLGDDLMAFALRYCNAHQTGWGWELGGASNLEELHARLDAVMLRRVRDQVLDLPPKLRTYMPVEVDLAGYRRHWLDYVAKARHLRRRGRRMGKRALLAEIAKLKQAAAIAKLPAAKALIEGMLDAGDKVLVFTGYHAVVDALAAHFGARAVKVTGRTGSAAREAAVAAFQHDPGVAVFVGNLQAAGTGVSLTAARQVVFTDYAFVPADHLQAEDRPCRIGQRHAVTVTYLSAAGTLDEDLEQLLAEKLAVAGAAIDGAPAARGSFVDDMLAVVSRRLGDAG